MLPDLDLQLQGARSEGVLVVEFYRSPHRSTINECAVGALHVPDEDGSLALLPGEISAGIRPANRPGVGHASLPGGPPLAGQPCSAGVGAGSTLKRTASNHWTCPHDMHTHGT